MVNQLVVVRLEFEYEHAGFKAFPSHLLQSLTSWYVCLLAVYVEMYLEPLCICSLTVMLVCWKTRAKNALKILNSVRKKCTLKNIKHNVFGRMEQLFSELTNIVFFSICLLLKMPNFPHPVFERPPGE